MFLQITTQESQQIMLPMFYFILEQNLKLTLKHSHTSERWIQGTKDSLGKTIHEA